MKYLEGIGGLFVQQQLQYESSWDKGLSDKDRNKIEEAFSKSLSLKEEGIQFTVLWTAINHKGELLVTALVHNFLGQTCSFHDQCLQYKEDNLLIAKHCFSLPTLMIPAKTSMPWTFIFPVGKLFQQPNWANGQLFSSQNDEY